ncbi:MAG: CDP-alcohol phosphatidyltransferase family protein [Salinibacter sp.]|uniref:CDP-alcohol phosphatidyltransferase family protein n=1 Tax=Salinibacter sp. TaxID=2065818 RepID=UPI0035D43E82
MPAFSTPDLGRFWTVPNALGLLRLVLVVPITVFLWQGGPLSWILGLIFLIVLTDWLDGRIARWTHTVSDWGKVIDPVADKFAAIMTVTALTFRPAEPLLPFWFFGVIVGRDLAILLGGLTIARRTGQITMSAWAGKAASLWLALTVLSIVLEADPPVLNVCLWTTTGLLLISFVVYVIRYLSLLRQHSPPRTSDGGPSGPSESGDSQGRGLPSPAPHAT